MIPSGLLPQWNECFTVRSYQTDFIKNMRLSALCECFQEAAGNHAEHLGLGYHDMKSGGLAWVLSRLYIEVKEMPAFRDEIRVETWPHRMERIFYRREFRVIRNDIPVVAATSYWLLLDTATKRPRVIPVNEGVIRANMDKPLTVKNTGTILPPRGGTVKEVEALYSDLDQNRHVNNARYVDWIFDQFELSRLERSLPRFIGIEYKHEVREHDRVLIRHCVNGSDEGTYYLEGTMPSAGKICFRSKVIF